VTLQRHAPPLPAIVPLLIALVHAAAAARIAEVETLTSVAALDTPVAYYPDLEEEILPQSADVLKAVRLVARY